LDYDLCAIGTDASGNPKLPVKRLLIMKK